MSARGAWALALKMANIIDKIENLISETRCSLLESSLRNFNSNFLIKGQI